VCKTCKPGYGLQNHQCVTSPNNPGSNPTNGTDFLTGDDPTIIESGKKGDDILVFILIIGGIVTSLFAVGGLYLGIKFARSIYMKRARYSRKVTPIQEDTSSPQTTQRLDLTDSSPTLQRIDALSTTHLQTTQSSPTQHTARRKAYQRINLMRNGSISPL